MRSTHKLFIAIILSVAFISSCSMRLADFTVISTKNVEIGVNKAKGVQTEGSKAYFLDIGLNIKDALDRALENAGPQYDLLVDGVITYTAYPFVSSIHVKGLAVSAADLRAELGEEGFRNWLTENSVYDPTNESSVNSVKTEE